MVDTAPCRTDLPVHRCGSLFAGGEAAVGIDFLRHFNYRVSGEYVYTYNCDEHIPLSFSPPASLRNYTDVAI